MSKPLHPPLPRPSSGTPSSSSADPSSPVLSSQAKNTIFVGRERELRELQEVWATASSGRGQVLLLVGEPGIGKTRLIEEFTTLVRQHEPLILWGRCWEGDGAPAFWPWIQIVRTYLQQHTDETITAEMGAGAIAIAQVVTEVHAKLPTLAPPPLLSPEDSRFRFFDSMTTWLKQTALRCPLLVVLDDLHWADTSSLLLLEFLARQVADIRMLVLGAYRDTEVHRTHPLAETLGGLARSSHRLILSGLSRDEATHFIENTTGETPATSLVTAMHERTDGNPFFLHEIIRLLTAEGSLANQSKETSALIRIPTGIRETLQRRVEQVSLSCREMLATASVIGREFSVALLALAAKEEAGEIRDQLLGLLQEALEAAIINSVPNDPDQYRFTHVLVRETLYEDLSLQERARLHRRVGEAIEQLYAAYLGPLCGYTSTRPATALVSLTKRAGALGRPSRQEARYDCSRPMPPCIWSTPASPLSRASWAAVPSVRASHSTSR